MQSKFYIIFIVLMMSTGCKKYLDKKSDKSLEIPTSIADAQALMDNADVFLYSLTAYATVCDDNYRATDSYVSSRDINTQYEYLWNANAAISQPAWANCYTIVLFANTALETLVKINPDQSNLDSYNQAKGMALVYRAFAHHCMMINMSLQYEFSKAKNELGIPYRTTSDINSKTTRPSIEDNYYSLISDLKAAIAILPNKANYSTRPTKGAAYGALARVYMSMADYNNALLYADSSLQLNNLLIDFNTLDLNSNTPFSRFNTEDLFHAVAGSPSGILRYPNWNCDSILYNSYDSSDLRKMCFFRGNSNGFYSFKGSYEDGGDACNYVGIATDEMFITRAECYARSGDKEKAIQDLNTLLISRYKKNRFVPYLSSNTQDILGLILHERRKELIGRGNIRWMDLKRLNLEPAYAKTLSRIYMGKTYTLPPNDDRYALLLPQGIIDATGIPQNIR